MADSTLVEYIKRIASIGRWRNLDGGLGQATTNKWLSIDDVLQVATQWVLGNFNSNFKIFICNGNLELLRNTTWQDDFQQTIFRLIKDWRRDCRLSLHQSAHALRILGLLPSGPAVLLEFTWTPETGRWGLKAGVKRKAIAIVLQSMTKDNTTGASVRNYRSRERKALFDYGVTFLLKIVRAWLGSCTRAEPFMSL